jgi:hypothetical protein
VLLSRLWHHLAEIPAACRDEIHQPQGSRCLLVERPLLKTLQRLTVGMYTHLPALQLRLPEQLLLSLAH